MADMPLSRSVSRDWGQGVVEEEQPMSKHYSAAFAKAAMALALPLAASGLQAQEPTQTDPPPTQDAEKSVPPTIDSNGDGTPDAWDRDSNGVADAWDTDGNGTPDTFDNDGDGAPDGPPGSETR
jgi:hypothetical protein